MIELALSTIPKEILLDSDMLGVIVYVYVFLLIIIFVGFVNILSIEKHELRLNQQKCFKFKHPIFFVITYSKDKRIVSKKTFVLEIVGYILTLAIIAVSIGSVWLNINMALMLLGVMAILSFAFGITTGMLASKFKNTLDPMI